jgi:hypothetical protein
MVRWRRSQKHGLYDKHITAAAELDFASQPAVIYAEKIVLKTNSRKLRHEDSLAELHGV